MTHILKLLLISTILIGCAHRIKDLKLTSVEAVDYQTDRAMTGDMKQSLQNFIKSRHINSNKVLKVKFSTKWRMDQIWKRGRPHYIRPNAWVCDEASEYNNHRQGDLLARRGVLWNGINLDSEDINYKTQVITSADERIEYYVYFLTQGGSDPFDFNLSIQPFQICFDVKASIYNPNKFFGVEKYESNTLKISNEIIRSALNR